MARGHPSFNRMVYDALKFLDHKAGSEYLDLEQVISLKYKERLPEGWAKNLRDELDNMVKKKSIIEKVRWNSFATRGRSSRGFPLPRPVGPCYCCEHPKDLTFGRRRCD